MTSQELNFVVEPTQKKIDTVAELCGMMSDYAGFFVIDYRGLTVKQLENVREQLRGVDAKCTVYKNTLVRRALAETNNPDLGECLNGPSAFVFFKTDPAATGKILKAAAKETKILKLKGGLVDGAACDADAANAIADLPSREELLGRVLATMLNPMSSIARVVDLIREQKEGAAA